MQSGARTRRPGYATLSSVFLFYDTTEDEYHTDPATIKERHTADCMSGFEQERLYVWV